MRTSIPLYHYLKNSLMKSIEEGAWSPGEMIPSESDLALQFHVSRTTVRQAIGDLVNSGYLIRRQGKGTYVAKPQKAIASSPLYDFTQELRMLGMQIEVTTQSVQLTACPCEVADQLGISPEPVMHVSRVAESKGARLFHQSSYLIFPIGIAMEGLLSRVDLFENIYNFLEKYGVKIGLSQQTVTAEFARVEDLNFLGTTKNEPVLVIRRFTHDITGLPIEYSEVRYSPGLYRYQVNLCR